MFVECLSNDTDRQGQIMLSIMIHYHFETSVKGEIYFLRISNPHSLLEEKGFGLRGLE